MEHPRLLRRVPPAALLLPALAVLAALVVQTFPNYDTAYHLVWGRELLDGHTPTVETYRARIREKTGLKTRADLVRYGLEAGLLTSEGTGEPGR